MTELMLTLPADDLVLQERIHAIPGLRAAPGKVFGQRDSIGAAALLLGMRTPGQVAPVDVALPDGLRDYQETGIRQLAGILKEMGGALLADDMGLGKTRQATALASGLTKKGGRIMVVCPAYVRETWLEELSKWGEKSVTVVRPGATKRHICAWTQAATSRWVICSYEMASKVFDVCFDDAPYFLIMDEGHLVKGRDAKRAKSLEQIGMMSKYRLLMTGTPMWSRPRDFYQLLKILFGNTFGTKWQFDLRYCGGHINDFGGMDNSGVSNAEELRQRLGCYMVRREKKDVLKELPPLTRQIIWCDPTPEAARSFQAAMRGFASGSVAAALLSTLKGKVEPVVDYAVQAKSFFLLTYMKEHVYQLQRLIEARGVPCRAITGDVSHEKRKQIVDELRTTRHGLVATIDSMGAGLNLQGLYTVGLMHNIDWVPLKLRQAEDRLHRLGQTEPVQWVYFAMRESMDAVVVRNVVSKLEAWQAIMGQSSNKGLKDALDDANPGMTEEQVLKNMYDDIQGDDDDET